MNQRQAKALRTKPPGDASAPERLVECILRCPFSLASMVRLTDYGSVIYRGEFYSIKRYRTEISIFFDRVKGKCQVKL